MLNLDPHEPTTWLLLGFGSTVPAICVGIIVWLFTRMEIRRLMRDRK